MFLGPQSALADAKWSGRERARAVAVVRSRRAARRDSTAAVRRLLRSDGRSVSPATRRTVVGRHGARAGSLTRPSRCRRSHERVPGPRVAARTMACGRPTGCSAASRRCTDSLCLASTSSSFRSSSPSEHATRAPKSVRDHALDTLPLVVATDPATVSAAPLTVRQSPVRFARSRSDTDLPLPLSGSS